jgi:YVTN family beta-propeller protein
LTNGGFKTVSVIDTVTNMVSATVDVGVDPVGVAVTPDGKRAYVTNHGSSNVSVIDTANNTVSATVDVGVDPFGARLPQMGNGRT